MVGYNIQKLKENKATELATYVRLGMLKRKCTGFGICEVQALTKSNYQGQPVYKKVVCHISRVNHSELIFSFFPKTMSLEDQIYYFGNSEFRVGEDFEMKGSVASALGLERFKIRRGTYKKYIVGSAHNIIFSSA